MNKNTARKWQVRKKAKEETNNESQAQINIKIHTLSQSQAQIMLPAKFPEFLRSQPFLLVQCGKDQILVENSSSTVEDRPDISILKSLVDISGIQVNAAGSFKGQIEKVSPQRHKQYVLQMVQLVESYFSRRDQYKVMKRLKETMTHAYLRKILRFDEVSLQVYAMLRNNQTVVKSGLIDRQTQVIFRTNCSKMSLCVQISVETFQLSEDKELYLQKMIDFMSVMIQRCANFNCSHRLAVVLFARCYYPQFSTLKEAYDYLLKESTVKSEEEKNEVNFAVALQKDYRGRIYQDMYRRIIIHTDNTQYFRENFWQMVSEFIYTLNWDPQSSHVGAFLRRSMNDRIRGNQVDPNPQNQDPKIKPFVHKLQGRLAQSRDSNMFEAVALVSQQYRHHYKFRSLSETGNTIIVLSAGSGVYETDKSTFSITKSYVYLTNVTSFWLGFRKRGECTLKAEVALVDRTPVYKPNDKEKLSGSETNCIEKQVYLSPMSHSTRIRDFFRLKSYVYPEQWSPAQKEEQTVFKQIHHCGEVLNHYKLCQTVKLHELQDYELTEQIVSFMTAYPITEHSLFVHQQLYDNKFLINNGQPPPKVPHHKNTEIETFSQDLQRIAISKDEWGMIGDDNEVQRILQRMRVAMERQAGKMTRQDKDGLIQRTSYGIVKSSNEIEQRLERGIETFSNQDAKHSLDGRSGISVWSQPMQRRKDSEHQSDTILEQSLSKRVNIFEETFKNKNHQYNAKEKSMARSQKTVSHSKERLRNNHYDSNIHYVIASFSDPTVRKLKAFVKKEYVDELKEQEDSIVSMFEMERVWKNLCFPLLTPIYTKYIMNFSSTQIHFDNTDIDERKNKKINILEDEMCKLLMKNYQITQTQGRHYHANNSAELSRGKISYRIELNDTNLLRRFIVDPKQQDRIVPYMLYRYLCYEDKDCRFGQKYVYLEDKNYYNHSKKKELETKRIKIGLIDDEPVKDCNFQDLMQMSSHSMPLLNVRLPSSSGVKGSFSVRRQRDPFLEFIRMFNDKYMENSIVITKGVPRFKGSTKRMEINFSKKANRTMFHHQDITLQVNTEYSSANLFEMTVEWGLCSSIIVREFVDNVCTLGRRSKLLPYCVPSEDIFANTVWSITTISQIIFRHQLSVRWLEGGLLHKGEWFWDSNGYFLHRTGMAFVQLRPEDRLVLWRDNNHQKKDRFGRQDSIHKQFSKFFMLAATYDIIADVVEQVVGMRQ